MLKYVKKYWLYALIAPLFMMGEVVMDLLQPKLMSTIIDEGVLGLSNQGVGNLQLIIHTGLIMIGIVIVGGICGVLSGVFANLCSQNFGNDIRKDCFKKIMSLSFEQVDRFSTGSLVTRVTNDITQVQNLVMQCIRGFVRTTMLFVGGIVCLLSLNINFGVVLCIALPVVLCSVIFFILKANPNFKILQKKLDKVNGVVQENVAGARVVKAYVKEEYEKERFGKANDELVSTQLRVLKLFSYMTPIANIVLNISVVAVIKIGAIEVQGGTATPGNIMAAITYLSQIMHGVMMLSMIFQTISRGNASAARLKEVLDCDPVIKDGRNENAENKYRVSEEIENKKGKVEFRNVSFSYPGSNQDMVLSNINLTIQPGETLAILGATGSGKTSLVNLIPRFYDVTGGSVLLDGQNVKDYPLKELRDKVAIALQKSELFSCSIEENILWGKESADLEEVKKAAGIAQAEEFILRQPAGYDTVVAESGTSLSGGQKQRIAVSRAILKGAEVLIFDDSTSALDLKTEENLFNALNKEYKHVTKIIIAQRVASVKTADRIAVIENGQIAACDTHEALLQSSPIYQDIYNSQLRNGGEIHE